MAVSKEQQIGQTTHNVYALVAYSSPGILLNTDSCSERNNRSQSMAEWAGGPVGPWRCISARSMLHRPESILDYGTCLNVLGRPSRYRYSSSFYSIMRIASSSPRLLRDVLQYQGFTTTTSQVHTTVAAPVVKNPLELGSGKDTRTAVSLQNLSPSTAIVEYHFTTSSMLTARIAV